MQVSASPGVTGLYLSQRVTRCDRVVVLKSARRPVSQGCIQVSASLGGTGWCCYASQRVARCHRVVVLKSARRPVSQGGGSEVSASPGVTGLYSSQRVARCDRVVVLKSARRPVSLFKSACRSVGQGGVSMQVSVARCHRVMALFTSARRCRRVVVLFKSACSPV